MPLGFMPGVYNRATGTRDAFGALSDDLVREDHPPMVSKSGDREYEEQLDIWNKRMVLVGDVRGRKVYAKKSWQGKVWYQIHPDAVAIPTNPPTSNHGKRRSNDLAWPYNDRNTAAHKRARVLAKGHNITCEGLGFSRPEDWHWTYWGPLGTIISLASTTGAGNKKEEDMPLTDADIGKIMNYPAYTGGPTVSEVLLALDKNLIPSLVNLVWDRRVDRGTDENGNRVLIPAIQELADVKTLAMQLAGRPTAEATVDIDEAALAASLSPLLSANLSSLSDADVRRIAAAAADEQARRLNG